MGAKRTVKDGVPHIEKAELLNGAFVPVPSNREAAILVAKGMTNGERPTPERKSLDGSLEQRRDLLREAIRAAHADAWWTTIVGTFDDHVVYEVETPEGVANFQATYTIDDGVVTLGTAEAVQITEVVAPAKAADAPGNKSTADPEIPAAASDDAAAPGAPAEVGGKANAKARVSALLAEVDLLDA
jgi:hypothetical protein